MPHNDYVRPDGQWPPEFVITPGDLRRFDVAQYQALDWDAGGTWVPLTPISLGGQGLVLTGGVSLGHTISGGVLTLSGGRVYLGASIYPSFQSAVSRVIEWPLLGSPLPQLLADTYAQPNDAIGPFGTRFAAAGVGTIVRPVPSRSLHNGATIASANVTFQIAQVHQAVPGVLPQALLVRSDWKPWTPGQWTAGAPYATGAIVMPTAAFNGGWPYVYAATGAGGTAGGAEPNWSTAITIGSTVSDGGVTWVCTGYAANGAPWKSATSGYVNGTAVIPEHANGLVYVVTGGAGTRTSAGSEPVWPLTIGATVTDNPGGNQVVWTCVGTARAASWTSGTVYLKGALVSASPDNGMYYLCTTAGTSGGGAPAWGTVVGGTTTDNTAVWTCLGSNPVGAGAYNVAAAGGVPASFGDYYDAGATQTMSVPCHGATTIDTVNYSYAYVIYDEAGTGAFQSVPTSPWATATLYVLSNIGTGPFVQPNPTNGFFYQCTVGGTSGSPAPTWPTIVGATVTEIHGSGGSGGTGPTWLCIGPAVPSNNLFLSVAFSFTSIADMRPE